VFVTHSRLKPSGTGDDRERLAGEIRELAGEFLPSRSFGDWPLECLIVTLPALPPSALRYVVEGAYFDSKLDILKMGLMVGAFFPFSNRPSFRNRGFFPMRSPVPFFAMRHMLEVDWRTLEERSEYLDAYRLHFPGSLPQPDSPTVEHEDPKSR